MLSFTTWIIVILIVALAYYLFKRQVAARNNKYTSLAEVRKIRPLRVVITGGSKGIGFGLAKKFASFGDQVCICSRRAPDDAVKELQTITKNSNIFGFVCDVSKYHQVEQFTQFSAQKMGGIDLFINNAGFAGTIKRDLINSDASAVAEMVNTNLTGTLFGCKSAMKYMSTQEAPFANPNKKPGWGHIYVMEGRGSRGESTPNGVTYGCTKYALIQLAKSLADEMNDTNVCVSKLQPGMVITDLLTNDATPQVKKFFNILAEDADIVSDYLVPKLRDSAGSRNRIAYLTYPEVIRRFATFFLRKNRFFDEQTGEYVYKKQQ